MRRKEFWIFLQYMSIPITTALLFLIWQDGFIGIMLAVFLDWLFVPAIIIAIISLVYTVRYKSKSKQNRIILSGHLVNILILVSYLVFEAPNRRCDASIMEKHYERNKERMECLYHYVYDEIKPGYEFFIEFEKEKVSALHIKQDQSDSLERHWNPSEFQIDLSLHKVGLNKNKLKHIKEQLADMDCISLEMIHNPRESFKIGFRRIGFGKYSYHIYRNPLTPDEMKQLNEDCSLVPYSSRVVFEYGAGAIGDICFPGRDN